LKSQNHLEVKKIKDNLKNAKKSQQKLEKKVFSLKKEVT
jgi:hypothetical protein